MGYTLKYRAMKKTYYFYKIEGINYQLVDTKVCKKPEMTSVYEDLKNDFNNFIIEGYGYTDNINDID